MGLIRLTYSKGQPVNVRRGKAELVFLYKLVIRSPVTMSRDKNPIATKVLRYQLRYILEWIIGGGLALVFGWTFCLVLQPAAAARPQTGKA